MRVASIAMVSFLAAAGALAPAHASRVCSNTLSDGRIIVQGPLIDSFGVPCSRALLLPSRDAGRQPLIVDSARFRGEIVVLGPHARGRHPLVAFVDPSFQRPRFGFDGRRFRTFEFDRNLSSGFVTGRAGGFTTGAIGPFTTFSNSGAIPAPSVSLAAPRQRVIGGRGLLLGRRR
jgi:hypothetical protein